MLRRRMDSWAGLSDVITGLERQGLDVELCQFPTGWRANLYPTRTAHSIVVASAWELTPWGAVQQAAWRALGSTELLRPWPCPLDSVPSTLER
jgi:hypothetical protein